MNQVVKVKRIKFVDITRELSHEVDLLLPLANLNFNLNENPGCTRFLQTPRFKLGGVCGI